ncbi:hypothetical protein DDT52_01180 [Brenneria roseae subsp. roseae]|nr:hypothetical protein DDT52_01180 [Brenneria roseae subsp. roseae]
MPRKAGRQVGHSSESLDYPNVRPGYPVENNVFPSFLFIPAFIRDINYSFYNLQNIRIIDTDNREIEFSLTN